MVADPPRCNATTRKNPPNPAKFVIFLTVLDDGRDGAPGLECPESVQYSLFYDILRYLLQFGLCGAVKVAEEEDDSLT